VTFVVPFPSGPLDVMARPLLQKLGDMWGKPTIIDNKTGATGTIGRTTVAALVQHGHDVVCLVRPGTGIQGEIEPNDRAQLFEGVAVREVDVTDAALVHDALAGAGFEAIVSCMASRTGVPKDAWAIDHRAHLNVLEAAQQAGVSHFVLLSAICVQKPLLAFQHAKLAFEASLIDSGLRYSIVRPTAFFKSLSGQIERVRKGRPFLVFGDGTLTSCKPISDGDLADYIASCLIDESRWNQILPIGGPGNAITPRAQGEALFAMLGQPPKFRSAPIALLDVIAATLGALGRHPGACSSWPPPPALWASYRLPKPIRCFSMLPMCWAASATCPSPCPVQG
jgi:divinyl chlorophyllide a 8-vinyl-reductase